MLLTNIQFNLEFCSGLGVQIRCCHKQSIKYRILRSQVNFSSDYRYLSFRNLNYFLKLFFLHVSIPIFFFRNRSGKNGNIFNLIPPQILHQQRGKQNRNNVAEAGQRRLTRTIYKELTASGTAPEPSARMKTQCPPNVAKNCKRKPHFTHHFCKSTVSVARVIPRCACLLPSQFYLCISHPICIIINIQTWSRLTKRK